MELNKQEVRTVEEVMFAGLLATAQGCGPEIIDLAYIRAQAESILDEVRSIITADLTRLFDKEGVAEEWNSGIEMAIRFVEGSAT